MTPKSVAASKEHFVVLDGLRGVAAFLVLIGHASAILLGGDHTYVPQKSLAVSFFFALSGFVIASTYESRVADGMSFVDFMQRRVVRLYPLIIVGALVGTGALYLTDTGFRESGQVLAHIICGLSAVPGPYAAFTFTHFVVNPPSWSLFNEMVAYAAFYLMLARLGARTLALTVVVAFAFYCLSFLPAAAGLPYLPTLALTLCQTIAAFGLGMMIWRNMAAVRRLTLVAPSWLLAAALIVICVLPAQFKIIDGVASVALFIPAIIVAGARRGRGGAHALERLLGDLSFPVYILHWPVLLLTRRFAEPVLGAHGAVAAGSIAAIATGWLALKAFDEPARAWLAARMNRLFGRRRQSVTA